MASLSARNRVLFPLLLLLLIAVFFLQLFIGSVSIPFASILNILAGKTIENEAWQAIILQSRLPSALAAIVAGGALSVSGLQMQTMFRNPVAGPYVLGISSGASLGVALLVLLSGQLGWHRYLAESSLANGSIILAASIGSGFVFLLIILLSYRVRDVVGLLIIGLMIGSTFGALIEIMQSFANKEELSNYIFWTFGSFRNIAINQVGLLTLIIASGVLLSVYLFKPLDLLLLGDVYAQSSGMNLPKTKLLLVVCSCLLAGSVTAFCGPIGFVGLAVPHIARFAFQTHTHKILTPASLIIGGIVCGLCNLIASLPGTDYVLPINAVTSLFGAPFVIWIMIKRKS